MGKTGPDGHPQRRPPGKTAPGPTAIVVYLSIGVSVRCGICEAETDDWPEILHRTRSDGVDPLRRERAFRESKSPVLFVHQLYPALGHRNPCHPGAGVEVAPALGCRRSEIGLPGHSRAGCQRRLTPPGWRRPATGRKPGTADFSRHMTGQPPGLPCYSLAFNGPHLALFANRVIIFGQKRFLFRPIQVILAAGIPIATCCPTGRGPSGRTPARERGTGGFCSSGPLGRRKISFHLSSQMRDPKACGGAEDINQL